MPVRFLSVGDRALAVEFGDAIDRGLSREVLRLDRVLCAATPADRKRTGIEILLQFATTYDAGR